MTWPKVKLGDVCDIFSGYAFKSELFNDVGEGLPLIRIGDVGRNSTKIFYSGAYQERYLMNDGDILVSLSGDFYACRWSAGKALLNQRVCRLEANDQFESGFLLYLLPDLLTELEAKTAAFTIKNLSVKSLAEVEIPLPPIAEQKRLASILDAADALRQQRRETLRVLDELAQSLFLELFSDPVDNTKNWQMCDIDSLCNLVRGSSPRPKADPRYYGGSVPRLMVADLTRDGFLVTPRIDSLTEEGAKLSRPVDAGTIVMAVSGNVGLVSQLAINACIHDGFVGFTKLNVEVVNPIFFMLTLHHLKSTHDNRKAGAIFQNTTTTDIKAMKIPLPPLALQQQFAAQIEELEAIKRRARESSTRLDALFACLQARAFAGELSDAD